MDKEVNDPKTEEKAIPQRPICGVEESLIEKENAGHVTVGNRAYHACKRQVQVGSYVTDA